MTQKHVLRSLFLGMSARIYARRHEVVVAGFAMIYILIMAHISIVRFVSLNAHYYDLGIMDQTVYNTSRGRFLELTNPQLLRNTSRLAIHFDPLMAVLAPLYRLHASPLVLMYAQTVILAIGGIAVFIIAAHVLRSRLLALAFSALYFMYYPMENANVFDFHAVTFATTGLLWAYLLLIIRPLRRDWLNTVAGCALLILSMFSKENVALTVAFLGAYMLIAGKHKKTSLAIMLFSLAFFAIVMYRVIPSYRGEGSFALKYFDTSHPLVMVRQFFSFSSIRYLAILLLPVAGLPILSLGHLAIALPDIMINLISSNGNMREAYFHYTSVITPFIMIASIYGFGNLLRILPALMPRKVHSYLIVPVLLFSLLINYRYGWSQRMPYIVNQGALDVLQEWRDALVDDTIVVSATGTIAPFFTERRHFIDFLFDPSFASVGQSREDVAAQIRKYEDADYVIIRKNDITTSDPLATDYYNDLIGNPDFALVSDTNGIEVYRRSR